MRETPENEAKQLAEFFQIMNKGIRKHGIKKIMEKLRYMNIGDSNENFELIRDFIIDSVCEELGVPKKDLFNYQKRGNVTVARKISIVLLKQRLDMSDSDLGRFFGGRCRQVAYGVMKQYNALKKDNKVDVTNFFQYYEPINEKIITYIETLKE